MKQFPFRTTLLLVATAVCLSLWAELPAEAMDLSGFGDGQKITGFEISPQYSVSSSELPGGTHLGVAIFDTTPGPGSDQDLRVDRGNALILQNSDFPDDNGGSDFFTEPNDDEDGGSIIFDFINPITPQSVDMIDIDGGSATMVFLTDENGKTRSYDVPHDWTGQTPDSIGWATLDLFVQGDQYGPGGGGPAVSSQESGFLVDNVVRIEFEFSYSGAINNFSFVPEPSSLGLMVMAGVPWVLRRRR